MFGLFNRKKQPQSGDSLQKVYDDNVRTIEFHGITKDGTYTQKKTFTLNQHDDMDRNRLEVFRVITENGFVDITVDLDKKGRLLAVAVERTNIGR